MATTRIGQCLAAVLMVAAQPVSAATFAVVGRTPSGAAQIGGVKATTLYGTSPSGGSGDGTLFGMTTAGVYTLLHQFSDSEGRAPNARLALDTDGDVYGTTPSAGANGVGTLWEYAAGGTMRTVHAFGRTHDGASPLQGPTLGTDGTFYGATSKGDVNTNGVVFGYAPGDGYAVIYNFLSGVDGHCPFSGLAVRGSATAVLYGTTVGHGYGGNPQGSVWKYTAKYGLKTLYVFQSKADGGWPDQAPVVDSADDLYGTTHLKNGNAFPGAIWTISGAGAFSVLHEMNSARDGDGPNSPLLIGSDGNLYGTTASGGAGGDGTVFSITPAGVLKVLHAFDGGVDGAAPSGNLVRAAGTGVIYGGTTDGVVFSITPSEP